MVMKNEDQIVLIGDVKRSKNNSEHKIITTILSLGIVRLALIINVPNSEDETVRIYVKPAGNGSNHGHSTVDRSVDKREARVDDGGLPSLAHDVE
jgi:hypothetical protein